MAQRRHVHINPQQRAELLWARDHHPKPYIRERTAAILKVADGQSLWQVGHHGLFKRRNHETISEWITRYLHDGLDGLIIHTGRGRKPAFSPSGPR